MAETTLLFKPTLTTIDSLTLDASVSETHTSDVEVTEHPVEDGVAVADHARVKPAGLVIEGIISNTPINRSQSLRVASSFGTTIQTTNPQDQLAGQPGYAEQAFTLLEQLRDSTKLITVVTGLKTYDDMILTNLSVPRNIQTGDALRFTATFKYVRRVKNQTTTQTVTATPQGKKKTSTGKQASSEADGGDQVSKTWLKGLSDSTGLSGALGLP